MKNTQKQLEEILKSRVRGIGAGSESAFDRKSLEYASRKVAAISGDVRRALELCRRAVEMTIERNTDASHDDNGDGSMHASKTMTVTIADVNRAVQELDFAPHIRLMATSPLHHRIMLASIALEMRFAMISPGRRVLPCSCLLLSNDVVMPASWNISSTLCNKQLCLLAIPPALEQLFI